MVECWWTSINVPLSAVQLHLVGSVLELGDDEEDDDEDDDDVAPVVYFQVLLARSRGVQCSGRRGRE